MPTRSGPRPRRFERPGLQPRTRRRPSLLDDRLHREDTTLIRDRLVDPGEEQQLVGEAGQSRRLLRRLTDRVGEVGATAIGSLCQFELDLEHGDRCAQLVTRVCHEGTLPIDRILEPSEECVQRRGQRRDLVACPRDGQRGGRVVLRDLRNLPPHAVHRAQSGAGEQPAADAGHDHRDAAARHQSRGSPWRRRRRSARARSRRRRSGAPRWSRRARPAPGTVLARVRLAPSCS